MKHLIKHVLSVCVLAKRKHQHQTCWCQSPPNFYSSKHIFVPIEFISSDKILNILRYLENNMKKSFYDKKLIKKLIKSAKDELQRRDEAFIQMLMNAD